MKSVEFSKVSSNNINEVSLKVTTKVLHFSNALKDSSVYGYQLHT